MKKSVYTKFLIGYFIFAIASVGVIYFGLEEMIFNSQITSSANSLYNHANAISQHYSANDYNIYDTSHDYTADIKELLIPSDETIWIVSPEGKVLYSSDKSQQKLALGDLNDYFSDIYYITGDFDNKINSEVLTVYSPIVNTYKTYGYVVINRPLDSVYASMLPITNSIYFTFVVIFILSFTILFVFHIWVYKPIYFISKATDEYAKGNFDYKDLNINSKTELGTLANKLNYMAKEINDIEDNQKKFIANISHDFRSPLTSIKGYLEAMLDGTIPPENQERYLNILLSETERLNKLTGNLLTLNTWGLKGARLDLSEFDLVPTIRSTIASFEVQCVQKKLILHVTFSDKSYLVNADKEKIQQVLYNLIDNAIKFSSTNSKILIDVSDKNDKVFVSVKDFGLGIPKNSLNKIWDRFYKSDVSRGKDKTGTGLGLSIVKEIITNHNENINVISTEGVGTEFIFTLQKSKKSLLPIIPS